MTIADGKQYTRCPDCKELSKLRQALRDANTRWTLGDERTVKLILSDADKANKFIDALRELFGEKR